MKTRTNANTSTSTASCPCIEDGWSCPRCNRINAPWVRQCSCCAPSTYTWDKITVNPCNKQLETKITDDNTFKVHPESITYTYSTNVNTLAGGSDYKDLITGNWINIFKTYTNSAKR